MDKVSDLFKELKDRINNPLVISFVVSWVFLNWRIFVGLFFYKSNELDVDKYKSYIDQAAAYSESFRTTEIRFDAGVINSDVYILAKNRTDAANVNLAAAKYTYIFRTKVLDYYQGKLTW